MRKYRVVLLLKSDLAKDKKEKLLDEVVKNAGKIEKNEVKDLGEKKLAYPIKKEKKGNFVLLNFQADKVAEDFERKIILNDEVLRHLVVRE